MSNYGRMSDQKKNKIYFPITNIGSVTLMMIFIVVCMVSFAALSLSTAATDYNTAKKSADHVTDYYKASNDAEEKLASLVQVLSETYAASDSPASYYKNLEEKIQAMEGLSFILNEADEGGALSASISYDCTINQKQALHVELACPYSENLSGEDLYPITCWQTTSTTQWEGDNSIKLIGQ